MKSLKEILLSRRFMREISILLSGFAVITLVIGIIVIVADPKDPETLAFGISSIFVALINAVLALFIRKGSIIALWISGILFVFDTIIQLLEQPKALVFRCILIVILIRFIRRERAGDSPANVSEEVSE